MEDISLRALRVLKEVDAIFCEDTRVTAKLLSAHDIKKPLKSLHEHSQDRAYNEVVSLLKIGKNIAYVSDAGTPGVSDPGGKLVEYVHRVFGNDAAITPVPGPSALVAAASIAGVPMNRFLFLGYPPAKKGRKKFFEEVISSLHPVIFYESSHRIIRSLRELHDALTPPHLPLYKGRGGGVIVCRELTKKFETIYRGAIDEVLPDIEKNPRGEFVVVVERKKARRASHGVRSRE